MKRSEELRTDGRIVPEVEPHLSDLLPDFLARRRADVVSMRQAVEQGEREAIRVFGHQMKGIGGSFGLDGISNIGRSIEQAAVDGNISDIRKLLDNLQEYLDSIEID